MFLEYRIHYLCSSDHRTVRGPSMHVHPSIAPLRLVKGTLGLELESVNKPVFIILSLSHYSLMLYISFPISFFFSEGIIHTQWLNMDNAIACTLRHGKYI